MASTPRKIAIIGGGFSGTILAAQLLRRAEKDSEVILIERRPQLGRGVAYGTKYDSHVLNVRAAGMSAFPDDTSHFAKWAEARPELFDEPITATDFLPRRIYGSYVQSVLEAANAEAKPGVRLTRVTDEAIDLHCEPGGVSIGLEHGEVISADKAVLAIGNFPPGHPESLSAELLQSERYVSDPWARGHLDALHRDDSVLLIGSGLTALDLTLAMRERGHRGTLFLLSRNGRMPQPHRLTAPYHDFLADVPSDTGLRNLLRIVRTEIRAAALQEIDWRAVFDAIRPHTQRLWKGLDLRDRVRFLKHVRAFWETHRHRLPTSVEEALSELVEAGRLQLVAGKLLDATEGDKSVTVRIKKRGNGGETTLEVGHIVNCTGPECDYRRMRHPLAVGLVGQGLVRADALALGLDVADDGALIDADGTPSERLFTLGPLRKGTLWETTAAPEIRVQAQELAKRLLAD